ncbi:MAG TPA: ATP-dependent helicase, partial [Caulifigura sp.]|nr:ATP-dependent helicase [Caulifigura sp.]
GRTGRISSERNGRAFTFVTKEEGEELTRIEIRINKMLDEWRAPDSNFFTPRETRYVEPEVEPVRSEDDFADFADFHVA